MGADSLVGGDGSDTASYAASNVAVVANLLTNVNSGGHAAGDTLGGIENLNGSEHNDILTGDHGDNMLRGGDGDDWLRGAGGADILQGGAGSDSAAYFGSDAGVNIHLGAGIAFGGHAECDVLVDIENVLGTLYGDTLVGDGGDNVLDGGASDDLLIGGSGSDLLIGGFNNDTASYTGSDAAVNVNLQAGTASGGHAAGDSLSGIENLSGSDHDDTLAGDTGGNALDGGEGDDVLIGWSGADSLVGDVGNDTASYAGSNAAVNVNLHAGTASGGHAAGDTLGGIENLIGSDHGDTLAGDTGDNILDGGAGDDVLIGWSGADSLVGGAGNDTASYAGSDAAVEVNLQAGTYIGGHAAGDTLTSIENLRGSGHGDTLTGDTGDNSLDGAAGDDVLTGGAGADSLVGGDGDDTASYAGSNAAVNVNLQTGTGSGGHAAGDTPSGIENLIGSDHGDTLTGDGGDNLIDGADGDDVLIGGSGADSLIGGVGGDTASYAGSDAAVNVNLLTGVHSGGHAAGDTLAGIENLAGSNHGDTLTGDAGDNTLDGADGDDVLRGATAPTPWWAATAAIPPPTPALIRP